MSRTAKFIRCLLVVIVLVLSVQVVAAQQGQVCAGFTSQLRLGTQARVIPGSANNVRQLPGVAQTKVGQIPGGKIMKLIGGPSCADNITWWHVNYNGLIGWTGEGQGAQRWMDANVTSSSTPNTPLNTLQGTAGSTLFVNQVCFLWDGQPLGRAVINDEIQAVENGSVVSFSIAEHSYEDAPDLCVPSSLVGTAVAITPFGGAIQPNFTEYGAGAAYQVALPLWAYSIPGQWQLSVSGFGITIDVQQAFQPVFERFGGDILLGGFQPGERVVVVYGIKNDTVEVPVDASIFETVEIVSPLDPIMDSFALDTTAITDIQMFSDTAATSSLQVELYEVSDAVAVLDNMSDDPAPNPFGIQLDSLAGTEVVIDGNGYYAGNFPLADNQRLVAVVSSSGTVIGAPGLHSLMFAGSDEATTNQTLYNAFFGSGAIRNGVPTDRTFAPAGSGLLYGGIGMTDSAIMDAGAFQVEAFCTAQGYSVGQDQNNWFCEDTSGAAVYTLVPEDFDWICQMTYNNPNAFAIQDAGTTTPAFNWRCYAWQ